MNNQIMGNYCQKPSKSISGLTNLWNLANINWEGDFTRMHEFCEWAKIADENDEWNQKRPTVDMGGCVFFSDGAYLRMLADTSQFRLFQKIFLDELPPHCLVNNPVFLEMLYETILSHVGLEEINTVELSDWLYHCIRYQYPAPLCEFYDTLVLRSLEDF